MRRTEQDAWIILENILRSVPVMDIPINDSDTLHAMMMLRMTRRNRNIVEKAEPHRGGTLSVMSRRAGRDEHIVCNAGKDIIDRGRRRTNCRQRCIQTFGLT